jgi:hypothetical protein
VMLAIPFCKQNSTKHDANPRKCVLHSGRCPPDNPKKTIPHRLWRSPLYTKGPHIAASDFVGAIHESPECNDIEDATAISERIKYMSPPPGGGVGEEHAYEHTLPRRCIFAIHTTAFSLSRHATAPSQRAPQVFAPFWASPLPLRRLYRGASRRPPPTKLVGNNGESRPSPYPLILRGRGTATKEKV